MFVLLIIFGFFYGCFRTEDWFYTIIILQSWNVFGVYLIFFLEFWVKFYDILYFIGISIISLRKISVYFSDFSELG